jgi:hypothetical protein
LRGGRILNADEKQGNKSEAPDHFNNFSGAPVTSGIFPAELAQYGSNKIHPLSPKYEFKNSTAPFISDTSNLNTNDSEQLGAPALSDRGLAKNRRAEANFSTLIPAKNMPVSVRGKLEFTINLY